MDASYKIQRGIHVHLIQFFMCPEFWVHITSFMVLLRLFYCLALYSSPQFQSASSTGFKLYPSSVKVYSTRGGTSA